MTRQLAITQRQAKTLVKVANEGKVIVEVTTPIGTIRLIPAELAPQAPAKKLDPEPKGYL